MPAAPERRARVLQVLGQSTGGVGRHVATVVEALDGREGLALDIAAPGDLRAPMPKRWVPVPIPRGPGFGHRAAVARLRSLLEEGGYGLVHGHGLRAGLDAVAAARLARVPSLITLHNLVRPEISGRARAVVYAPMEPVVMRLSTRTLAVSEQMADHLLGVASRSAAKIEVLHVGVGEPPVVTRTRDEVRAELGLADESLIVTAVRLVPQKNLPVMLRAVAGLSSSAVLAVVGEGRLRASLEDLAQELGIAERVRWLGWRADAADLIAAADVLCLSSTWEAVPLAAQEAVLLGVPVVSTDVGGLRELVRDGETGRLVPSDDPGALATALDNLLFDRDRAARLASAALTDYEARFSRVRMLDRLASLYLALAVASGPS
ncbi:hypothetical protein BH18ACT15_BH18ACT15_14470 [soil metagenome]